jgi:hypothetical protein
MPQKTAIELSEENDSLILSTQVSAARSIKSIDETGSFSIVYLSQNRICSIVGIFIFGNIFDNYSL